jgi:uncharacterized membrane protein YoaK (UPF0700 family)
VLIAIVLAETVGAWVYLGFLALAIGGDPGGWRVAGYFALYAVAFAILAVGLVRRRRWVRAPLIVLQLLLSVIGASLVAGGNPVPGVLLVVIPVACAGLLLTSTTRAELAPNRTA